MCFSYLLASITTIENRYNVGETEVFRLRNEAFPLVWESIDHPGKIGYFDKARYEKHGEDPTEENLSRFGYCAKPGRFIKKVSPNLSDCKVSELAEEYASCFLLTPEVYDTPSEVYNSRNYADKDETLGSCMTDEDYVTFYDENGVKGVAVSNADGIVARTLLWEGCRVISTDRIISFIDRVYGSPQGEVALQRWAKKQGYHIRSNGGSFYSPDGVSEELSLSYDLPNAKCGVYPYIDTMCYINLNGGMAYNVCKSCTVTARNQSGTIEGAFCDNCGRFTEELNDTPGGLYCDDCASDHYYNLDGEWFDNDDVFCCEGCGEVYHINDYNGTEYGGICPSCAEDDYMWDSDRGYLIPLSDCTYCAGCREYHISGDFYDTDDDEQVCSDCIENGYWILYDGIAYRDKDCITCDICNEHHPLEVSTCKGENHLCPNCAGDAVRYELTTWHENRYKVGARLEVHKI
jgi:hypothetical protein